MRKKTCIIAFFIIAISFSTFMALNYNFYVNKVFDNDQNEFMKNLENSNSGLQNVIVFFNTSTYNPNVKLRFIQYGGILKQGCDWNNTFNSISGFAGTIPKENISLFSSEFSNINIENDEVVKTQLNYAIIQSEIANSTWYINGYKGKTNSSIAILDSGINPNQEFLKNKIIGWRDFISNSPVIHDDNGHGTFISAIISGTGTTDNSSNKQVTITFRDNYSHLDFFEDYVSSGNYSIKIFSFNVSKRNEILRINSTWSSIEPGIEKFWVELRKNSSILSRSYNVLTDKVYSINYNISISGEGIYDIYLKYQKSLNSIPRFSFLINVSFFPEVYLKNYKYFTGLANYTKILSYKVANETGLGEVSDLISAFSDLLQNATRYQVICALLSVGTLENGVKAINRVIDDVIEEGIFVVIASGNFGIKSSNPLNRLAINKRAIVVGAINDKDQVASYSSMGKNVGNNVIKPDIVAPGGSDLSGHRNLISVGHNNNEITAGRGTSISAAIVASTINLLIEAKWGSWTNWYSNNPQLYVKILKAILLMSATETNLPREDDPYTDIVESRYSPTIFNGNLESIKDVHEGYGRINVKTAIDALTKWMNVNETINASLVSSAKNPLGTHAFARRISFQTNKQYLINISKANPNSIIQIFLFSNNSNKYGEPILFKTSQKTYGNQDHLFFIPKRNQTECILVVKILQGETNFSLEVSNVKNKFAPELKVPEIFYAGGAKNATVISLQEFIGNEPDNNYTVDQYRFYIEYFDNDTSNVPPQEVVLHIVEKGKNYTMVQAIEMDNNYTNGALFQSDYLKFYTPKIYHYYFTASDGKFKVRYPVAGYLKIDVKYPKNSLKIPYHHSFNDGLGNWTIDGTGWGLLNQTNSIDNRSGVRIGIWHCIYFGREHDFPKNYSYQPYLLSNPYPNGSITSPLIDLNGLNETLIKPIVKFGIRTSINIGDFIYLQISVNLSIWTTLITFTNEEKDWHVIKINLTEYIGNFIQLRFIANLDENFDPINYKGFMVDFFSLENYTNKKAPQIYFDINSDISSRTNSKYENYIFSINYYDEDNNYPDYMYLEIDNKNYSMVNVEGAWNASYFKDGLIGIIFEKSLRIADFANLSFRFHAYDGKYSIKTQWYYRNNEFFSFSELAPLQFNIPFANKTIGYSFSSSNLTDYYVIGEPMPKDFTPWLQGDNSWHPITILSTNYIYGGRGLSYGGTYQGYGQDWDIQLITRPIYLPGEYKTYLRFYHEISLQNEYYLDDSEVDRCILAISDDNGNTWTTLKEYIYNSESLSGNVSIDISDYAEKTVLVMFRLKTNTYTVGLGYGWLLSNVYIGYDENTDFIPPKIKFITPLENSVVNSIITIKANISDETSLDKTKIFLMINNKAIPREDLNFNATTGLLTYKWDTQYFSDGKIILKIIAYDKEGNRAEKYIEVTVNNGFFNWKTWRPWLLLISGITILGIILYIISGKKGKIWIEKVRNYNIEKIRQREEYKERMLEKVKKIEAKDDSNRPFILYCRYCDSWFESNKFRYICPRCDRDQLFVAYNCLNCGKWYFKDEPGDNYYCKNKSCKGIKLIRREVDDIKRILESEGIKLRKDEFRRKKYSILD